MIFVIEKMTLIRRTIGFVLLILGVLLFAGCDAVKQESTAVSEQQLSELTQMVAEMRQELKLVTKEVVALNSKVDGLKTSPAQLAAAQPNKIQRVSMGTTFDSALGSDKAEYALIEFMDYQCPYCLRYASQTFPQIKSRYIDTGQLRYVIRDYPLNFHAKATGAAVAARCAAKQGQFWGMHRALITHAKQLGEALYHDQAMALNLDLDEFSQCLSAQEMMQQVNDDIAYGNTVGVRGTPRFYLGKIEGNDIVDVLTISGARPFNYFDKALRRLMN
jgi:protein-disulfide isomerase